MNVVKGGYAHDSSDTEWGIVNSLLCGQYRTTTRWMGPEGLSPCSRKDAATDQTIGRVTDSHSSSRCGLGIASNRHHGDVVLLPKLLRRLYNCGCRLR